LPSAGGGLEELHRHGGGLEELHRHAARKSDKPLYKGAIQRIKYLVYILGERVEDYDWSFTMQRGFALPSTGVVTILSKEEEKEV